MNENRTADMLGYPAAAASLFGGFEAIMGEWEMSALSFALSTMMFASANHLRSRAGSK